MSLPGAKRKGLVGADEGQTPSGKGLSLPRVSSTGRQLHPVRHPAGHSYHSEAIPVEEASFDSEMFLWGIDLFIMAITRKPMSLGRSVALKPSAFGKTGDASSQQLFQPYFSR